MNLPATSTSAQWREQIAMLAKVMDHLALDSLCCEI